MASRQTLERRLAAIVSADITGYGLMMAADEDDTHRRVGDLISSLTRRVKRSVAEYSTALELNPNDADVMADLADALMYDDNGAEAVRWMKRALELNPLAPDWYYWHLADAYSSLGQYEAVIATVQRMKGPGLCCRLTAVSFAQLGRLEEARRCAEEVLRRQPGFRISEWAKVIPHSNKERLNRFVEGLRKAGLPD